MKLRKNNIILSLLTFLVVIYIIWSQAIIYNYRESLKIEKNRVYNIADHLEFWKETILESNGYLSTEKMVKDKRNIELFEITRKDGSVIADDEMLYIMFYDKVDKKRKNELDRYFSDLVLRNYFYIITDKNKKIKEMFWDKA